MRPVWIPFLLAAGLEGNLPWLRAPRLLVLMLTWGCAFQLPWGDNPSTLLREGLVKQKYVRDIWSWATFYGENLAQTLSKTRLNPFEILRNATRILQELSSNSDRSSFEFRSSFDWDVHEPRWASARRMIRSFLSLVKICMNLYESLQSAHVFPYRAEIVQRTIC